MTDYLSGKEMFIRFTMLVFCDCLSICSGVCASFPFGFEIGMWNLIVLVPDHCLSVYLVWGNRAFLFCMQLHN